MKQFNFYLETIGKYVFTIYKIKEGSFVLQVEEYNKPIIYINIDVFSMGIMLLELSQNIPEDSFDLKEISNKYNVFSLKTEKIYSEYNIKIINCSKEICLSFQNYKCYFNFIMFLKNVYTLIWKEQEP